jgi:hypothetical protein
LSTNQKKKKNKVYFGKREEEAVVKYLLSDPNPDAEWERLYNIDDAERERLFSIVIYPALVSLAEGIIRSYKIGRNDMDFATLRDDALGFLLIKFTRFTPGGKGRAYSYYGTALRRYLMQTSNRQNKRDGQYSDIEEMTEDSKYSYEMYYYMGVDVDSITIDRLQFMIVELEWLIDKNIDNKNFVRISSTLIYILKNYSNFTITKKHELYYLLREYTGCSTKEITSSMHKIRTIYKMVRSDFDNFIY